MPLYLSILLNSSSGIHVHGLQTMSRASVLDGPSGDATHGSALVQSSQEKALSMDRHSHTTQPLYSPTLCDTDPWPQ